MGLRPWVYGQVGAACVCMCSMRVLGPGRWRTHLGAFWKKPHRVGCSTCPPVGRRAAQLAPTIGTTRAGLRSRGLWAPVLQGEGGVKRPGRGHVSRVVRGTRQR